MMEHVYMSEKPHHPSEIPRDHLGLVSGAFYVWWAYWWLRRWRSEVFNFRIRWHTGGVKDFQIPIRFAGKNNLSRMAFDLFAVPAMLLFSSCFGYPALNCPTFLKFSELCALLRTAEEMYILGGGRWLMALNFGRPWHREKGSRGIRSHPRSSCRMDGDLQILKMR